VVVVVEGRWLGVGWEEADASEWEQRVHGPGAELQMQAAMLQMQAVMPWCGCGQRRSSLHRRAAALEPSVAAPLQHQP
jgi:hypothetical protein